VAGSNGKTTTKNILASVLSQKFNTLCSEASFNNDVGVPATLLNLEPEHQVAVLEFGTNHPGELAPLLNLAQPQYGVLTGIGREHLEFFGGLAGVLEEEGWLAEVLPPTGRLFINGDTWGAEALMKRARASVVRAGFGPANDWQASRVRMEETGMTFDVKKGAASFCRQFRLPLFGQHQVLNALLAIAVAAELGMSPEDVQRGLLSCMPAKMRLELCRSGPIRMLDDSYNANADSMRAALETLRDFPCRGRRIAVLGDMAELGEHARAAHVEIGRFVPEAKVEHLFTLGEMASVTAEAARAAGLRSVQECADVGSAAEALRKLARPDDIVLLKASRVAGLERVRQLLDSRGTCAD
jgi:UDP-N-acetylmuramoyl-tripeptide--D-alanyl-D-alanine ligase